MQITELRNKSLISIPFSQFLLQVTVALGLIGSPSLSLPSPFCPLPLPILSSLRLL